VNVRDMNQGPSLPVGVFHFPADLEVPLVGARRLAEALGLEVEIAEAAPFPAFAAAVLTSGVDVDALFQARSGLIVSQLLTVNVSQASS
jgi:hypothetical protein